MMRHRPSAVLRRASFVVALLLLVLPARPGGRAAAAVPDGFLISPLVTGLTEATAMAFAPDGRLFVLEQGGAVRVVKDGALLPAPFATLPAQNYGERGLLGIAFDPDFAANGYVYVYYTTTETPPRNRVSRLRADGDTAAPGSETIILNLDPLSTARNHNGGALHFGADGKLYIATGDNANTANSQTLDNRHGKLLRVNPDGTIPADNPFYATAAGANRAVWALGLRNPYTFAVRPGTGEILINDVGARTWEEINAGAAGANYGWPACEGACATAGFHDPIYAYDHNAGCAITAGAFYDPPAPQFPAEYAGSYFFADYCGGWIRRLDRATGTATPFADGIDGPVDLDVGPDGALYYLARGGGAIGRIEYAADRPPSIYAHPADRTATAGQAVTFSVGVTGSAPLNYQWQRDEADIPGANGASYTLPAVTAADDGARFRVVVWNTHGTATSNAATLSVTANQPPVATITRPATGALYSGGDTIRYAATATDAEDGALPATAFTWRVEFHHDTHTHPFIPDTSGRRNGRFTIPRTGETATDVWYRIHLTVRDSAGATHSTHVDVRPRLVRLTLATTPPGLTVTLNGQPHVAPYTFDSVVGIRHTLGAPSPQTLGGETFRFRAWSDGKAATHTITAPARERTITATFRR